MSEPPTLVLSTPSAITALKISPQNPDSLVTGSQDGTIRIYSLADGKVKRAVRPLTGEISCICPERLDAPLRVWAASGKEVWLFDLSDGPLILDKCDALERITLLDGTEEDNVLNQIDVNSSSLAYSCDSGEVGVLELSSRRKTVMKRSHSNICNTVGFIPSRPKEIISGGFDNKLLHFDIGSSTVVASHEFYTTPTSMGASLSPPFVLCMAFSALGSVAVSLADGRVWLSRGGTRSGSTTKAKRQRRWGGLSRADQENALEFKVAEGPIVAVDFLTESVIITLTLSGVVRIQSLPSAPSPRSTANEPSVTSLWSTNTHHIRKTNGITHGLRGPTQGEDVSGVLSRWIIVGGIGDNGKGFVEAWVVPETVISGARNTA